MDISGKKVSENKDAGSPSPLLHSRKFTVPQAAKLLGLGETKLRHIISIGGIQQPIVNQLGKASLRKGDCLVI